MILTWRFGCVADYKRLTKYAHYLVGGGLGPLAAAMIRDGNIVGEKFDAGSRAWHGRKWRFTRGHTM
jgi:hypothetical protein